MGKYKMKRKIIKQKGLEIDVIKRFIKHESRNGLFKI